MNENKKFMISKAVETGDWDNVEEHVTRKDLIEWIIEMTLPDVDDKGVHKKKIKKVKCPVCGKTNAPYKMTLTYRNIAYLMGAVYLSKKDLDKGGDGYIHHSVIHDFVIGKFEHHKGKKKNTGIDFTSYGTMTKFPWNFLQPQVDSNQKIKRNGEFKPTPECYEFLRLNLEVPEYIYIMDNEVIRLSNKKIKANMAKDVKFKEFVELYNSF